jgi:hypothetical protein
MDECRGGPLTRVTAVESPLDQLSMPRKSKRKKTKDTSSDETSA